ncbi:MAG TPA: AMP-dependent synthetase/ligase [Longimicrobiales bacterium]
MAIENLIQLLRARAVERPDRVLLRFHRDGTWRDWSYGLVLHRVEAIAGGLEVLGVRPGDRAAIVSGARPEWWLAELGGLAAGAVVLGIDARLPAEEVTCILDHVEARVAFVEDRNQAARLAAVRHRVPQLAHVVVLDAEAPDDAGVLSLAALESLPAPGQGAVRLDRTARRPREAPATICYTGGTTGLPKGALLTHGNVIGALAAVARAFAGALRPVERVLCPVPPSRALGRVCGEYAALFLGRTLTFGRGVDRLLEDAGALGPDALVAAPRILERIRDGVGARPPRDALGGRLSVIFCGGAPLDPALARFYEADGIRVFDGWGLAETAGPVTANRPDASRPGSAGRPLPGIEVRVAPDGELLVHGPNVFSSYFRDPERTAEAFDEHGFLRTGDIGHIDDDGFVFVTGRKNELIVNADGRSVAPQKIEQLLRERPFIAHALAYGDRRPFIVALLAIDREAVAAWHPELTDRPVGDPALHAIVEEEVRRVNDRLPESERIRAFRLLDGADSGGLAVLRRLRRPEAEARFRPLLDELYIAEQVASRPS